MKIVVKMVYGLKNFDNLFFMMMLKCSDLRVEAFEEDSVRAHTSCRRLEDASVFSSNMAEF